MDTPGVEDGGQQTARLSAPDEGSSAAALHYLCACQHGAMLDTLRADARQKKVPLPELGKAFEEDQAENSKVWEALQVILPTRRELRLAYLLYYCGLGPIEIVRFCPQEWSDVQEIYHLRRAILDRLMRDGDQLRWRLKHEERW
jgi:hypothetical protein